MAIGQQHGKSSGNGSERQFKSVTPTLDESSPGCVVVTPAVPITGTDDLTRPLVKLPQVPNDGTKVVSTKLLRPWFPRVWTNYAST